MNLADWALASILGPTLGGFITDNWGWRWVFYINVPVAFAAIVVALLTLPRHIASARGSVDYLGAALLVAGVVPMLLAFTWAGSTYAWISPQVVGLLVFSAVVLGLFLLVEHRASEPILPLGLFRNGIFTVSTLATAIAGISLFGATLYLALFVQGVLGQSATSSGLVGTPTMLGVLIGGVVGGQLVSRIGHYRVVAVIGAVEPLIIVR